MVLEPGMWQTQDKIFDALKSNVAPELTYPVNSSNTALLLTVAYNYE